ncbi:DUF397 domain-containing protein [Spongiactinospora rosea]|uniref:DUF397 domain-containing protein n=1 Tax=Spongiactinospora rosea TaxID=2248750 RepID=A0A366M089_9ACTN|nr:DUF397 domain-containing protein [Spongiactinospora rosea]RBQ19625.1 DUF397 domain-containing protein [Spongiactinospora rosea]
MDVVWRKSSRSGGITDNCVEVAHISETIAVRDSKDPNGPRLVFSASEWSTFVRDLKAGNLDPGRLS